jgi:DNA-binding SARP family transcriptional activator
MQEGPVPLLRVYTFGAFELAWHAVPETAEAVWESRTSARSLFKLLLCAPGRQASKSQLAGILWPEIDEERARESLRSAYKVLRKVLRTASGEELIAQRTTDEIIHLAEQARLWVDADAFEELVSQASRATSEEAALTLWEEANALLRGEFLADDQSAEWAHHRLVKKRQQGLWLARCRMIRHLADLYVLRGQTSLAEETLETHLLHFPADQDALYRVLLLLEQQGCLEQASILYERSRHMLETRGKKLSQHVCVLYERFQGTLSSQTERTSPAAVLAVVAKPASSAALQDPERGWAGTMSQVLSLLGAGRRQDSSLDVLRALIEPEGAGGQDMAQLSRRQLLELGVAALISRLAQLDQKRIAAVDREELGWVLGKGIADGWKLLLTTANAELLAVSQFQLALIHQAHPLLYPTTRSYLYAGAYGLVGLALHHQNRSEEALHAYHHAHLAAIATRDPWYIAQSLICQADAYQALGMYTEALHVIEEALLGLGEVDEEHRRARAHLLGCWADVAMTMGDYSLARRKLDESALSLEHLSANEEFDSSCWLNLAGKHAFATGKYPTAIGYFEQSLTESSPDWMIHRVFALLPMMASYACEGDHDACVATAEAALAALSVLNAPALNRIFTTTGREILKAFPHDARLRSLLVAAQRQLTGWACSLARDIVQ